MKQRNHSLKNHIGFTLVEVVLCLSLASIIFGVTSNFLLQFFGSYSFVANQSQNLSDIRLGLERINSEVLRLGPTDITYIDADTIEFNDTDGVATDYHLGANGRVLRDTKLLTTGVSTLTFQYFDLNNDETTVIADIRKIKITITGSAGTTDENLTLSTTATPRRLIYAGYE